jgi:ankyrin repeat protein
MKLIKSLFFSFLLTTGAASAMNPAPELSQAERTKLGEQLLDAIEQQDQERAQQLIAAGADVNVRTFLGNTPLVLCSCWNNQKIAAQLADRMLRTPTAKQYQRTRTFLMCLKRLNAHPQLRYAFKEPLLCMITQENAENPGSLFRQQIDKMNSTDMKQYLLDKYLPKKTT